MPTRAANGIALSAGVILRDGIGAPEGVVTAPPGSQYYQSNGAEFRKATGTGNTGWETRTRVVSLTQAAYNALATPRNSSILYVITG